ncbi:ABC transporter ATP-binding protein [Geomicrobium sediminis]|uniref:ABC transporter ATP-binding protein n=1 Tax=Geomicrobium sediminis TaxID=1347788 RepID=A0ABS2P6T3_9BACL|nr:ABC transporter ATP-binding protein [Geomicrobium sediminis]MBM7631104.1 hypothetical protein [Geomicrobium sediminis]
MLKARAERKALESTYYHRARIERYESYVEEWRETRQGYRMKYDDKPCALSQASRSNSTQTQGPNQIDYDAKLFCSPKLLIKPGDRVTVTFENGLERQFEAGEPFPYPHHQEIPLLREDDA